MAAEPPGCPIVHRDNLSNYNVSQSGANADLTSKEHPLESDKLRPLTGIIGLISGLLPLLGFRQTSFLPAVRLPGVSPCRARSPVRSIWQPPSFSWLDQRVALDDSTIRMVLLYVVKAVFGASRRPSLPARSTRDRPLWARKSHGAGQAANP